MSTKDESLTPKANDEKEKEVSFQDQKGATVGNDTSPEITLVQTRLPGRKYPRSFQIMPS